MLFLLSCLAFLCQEMVLASVNDVKGMSHKTWIRSSPFQIWRSTMMNFTLQGQVHQSKEEPEESEAGISETRFGSSRPRPKLKMSESQ